MAHIDAALLRDAETRVDRYEAGRRTRGHAQRYDWQPGDGTRYEFVVAVLANDDPDAGALIVVSLLNIENGTCYSMVRNGWEHCTPGHLASKLNARVYNAAAFLRFVWAVLDVNSAGPMRDLIAEVGVVR